MMHRCLERAVIIALISALCTLYPHAVSGQTKLVKATVAYRNVQGHAILADVYRPEGKAVCPVIVWIHGGALIMGHRESIHREVRQLAEEKAYALVSIDYRLAPETKLPQLISDVEAAFRWLAEDGARQFHLDSNRIVVCGGSAGGYLTLVTGYRATPQPKALVALYGYGDLIGDWYSRPSPHPRHNPRTIGREEARQQSDGSVVSDARQRKGNGGLIYLHYRQNGSWPQAVSGFDAEEIAARIAPFEPLRNVSKDYPPTMLIHGTKDTDVPYEQSVMMAKRLQQVGVPVIFKTIPDAEHGFAGARPEDLRKAYERMRTFITEHISGP